MRHGSPVARWRSPEACCTALAGLTRPAREIVAASCMELMGCVEPRPHTRYGIRHTHIAYAHARHTHRHTSLRGRSGDLVERMVPPVKGKGRSAIAERDTVELLHGLAQGLHVVRDEVGPTVQYVANKAMKAAARLTAASASWLSRRPPPADLLQTSCRPAPADPLTRPRPRATQGCHVGLVFDLGVARHAPGRGGELLAHVAREGARAPRGGQRARLVAHEHDRAWRQAG